MFIWPPLSSALYLLYSKKCALLLFICFCHTIAIHSSCNRCVKGTLKRSFTQKWTKYQYFLTVTLFRSHNRRIFFHQCSYYNQCSFWHHYQTLHCTDITQKCYSSFLCEIIQQKNTACFVTAVKSALKRIVHSKMY